MSIEKHIAKRIVDKKSKLDSLRPFSPAVLQRLREQLIVEWTYNSNAIEGNTLTLQETKLVLEQGVTIGGKSVREHFEAINHKEAIEFIEHLTSKEEPLSVHNLRQMHALILKGIDDTEAGNYRKVPVTIAGSSFVPADPSQVPALMDSFDRWLKIEEGKGNTVEFAALAHYKFIAIHPFVDGNGRTARLLMNLILMRGGYPPSVILKTDRMVYYRTLQQADDKEVTPFVNFVARSVDRALTIYLQALEVVTKPEEVQARGFISLSQAAKLTPYSPKYLNLLARTGRLEAIKQGRNWVTTKKAIEEYLASIKR